jgi:broad specificity phosphatase PhoE
MSRLRRIVMIRHSETVGNSSVRFHGRGDPPLSEEGREHMREAARGLRGEVFDLVVASPKQRAWESAQIVAGGAPVRLEPDFREVDFGRWEGLTAEEIEDRDPVLYKDWRARASGFEFPGGERRKDFTERVHRGLDRLLASDVPCVLLVAHKGPIRTIAEKLRGEPLPDGLPDLGQAVGLSLGNDGQWHLGRRGSNPPGVGG